MWMRANKKDLIAVAQKLETLCYSEWVTVEINDNTTHLRFKFNDKDQKDVAIEVFWAQKGITPVITRSEPMYKED